VSEIWDSRSSLAAGHTLLGLLGGCLILRVGLGLAGSRGLGHLEMWFLFE